MIQQQFEKLSYSKIFQSILSFNSLKYFIDYNTFPHLSEFWCLGIHGFMENSNLDEESIGVEVSLEEIGMDETGQIVSYIDVENSQDPYIGKEFQSLDYSFKFYLDYAHRSDFSIHRGRMIRSRKDKLIIG
ncbi:hypothetical protein CQW23_02079 [Capsicum baccatum]|uniref:Uncharacterized protein n=1 Tax=Capsicum baccatum TaxID=33114 RepID=A0A2G2XQD8_CAPBA|nr:hypothetical protein CQW23_02079 [Capsicum baccatum]